MGVGGRDKGLVGPGAVSWGGCHRQLALGEFPPGGRGLICGGRGLCQKASRVNAFYFPLF